jgi:hypothetical protein
VTELIHDLLFNGSGCHASWWEAVLIIPLIGEGIKCALGSVALNVFLWITEILVKLIVLIAILIALFRLWFQLIKTYLTFIIFVILGPLWIVLGLIPGRPMGFEKWLRIEFANLAVFPVVAFLLVFARVIKDAIPNAAAQTVFVPPLVGNQNLSTFSDLMAFGAILLAPTIPDLIRSQLKAKSQNNLGAAVAGTALAGAAAFSAPGKRIWENLNHRNPTTGEPEGALAVRKQQLWEKTPYFGKRAVAKKASLRQIHRGVDDDNNPVTMADHRRLMAKSVAAQNTENANGGRAARKSATRDAVRDTRSQTKVGRAINRAGDARTAATAPVRTAGTEARTRAQGFLGRAFSRVRGRASGTTGIPGTDGATGGTGTSPLPSYPRPPRVPRTSGTTPPAPHGGSTTGGATTAPVTPTKRKGLRAAYTRWRNNGRRKSRSNRGGRLGDPRDTDND